MTEWLGGVKLAYPADFLLHAVSTGGETLGFRMSDIFALICVRIKVRSEHATNVGFYAGKACSKWYRGHRLRRRRGGRNSARVPGYRLVRAYLLLLLLLDNVTQNMNTPRGPPRNVAPRLVETGLGILRVRA
eukprot:1527348-Prymnesium_polylepis.1